ncbi:DUF3422 family protein [Roseinatronobacter alkalisoli]|uniref:DUF3422 domain-containing protein n=1 Tax=Roseinatronobacter alkalisoli TaxID=3028235 RepID=A0ABT5T4X8_9RHOB|nr:DUF3422 domain-containing protein [Roseinatronobacter sp. HJB301]MDD7970170.1 DUF3422 domain-containing protein [Roseinatronobacter sp. HJB301]
MPPLEDHPHRYALVNELHARPATKVAGPGVAAFLAIKPANGADKRDRNKDRDHLLALVNRYGAAHPAPDATHHSADIGRYHLKWESHTEFVTYTAVEQGQPKRPFDPGSFDVFADDWLAQAPGERLTSILFQIEELPEDRADIITKLRDWFVPESLAAASVLDGSAVIASDFRIDRAGHVRMAVFIKPGTGGRRVGRILQRLCEIETYKTISMLGLLCARDLSPQMGLLDEQLTQLSRAMNTPGTRTEETLEALLRISGELENMMVESAFRFAATEAYEALVHQRIDVLREERFEGRQSLREFMTRRYDPAMRTVKSTEARLTRLAERAMRAGQLLRSRVDVERSAQNQRLLESMDRRADLQLRLQHTVEGLSVVAISYYAVNLVAYLVLPVTEPLGLSKPVTMAALVPVVVLGVWAMVRGIRRRFE